MRKEVEGFRNYRVETDSETLKTATASPKTADPSIL